MADFQSPLAAELLDYWQNRRSVRASPSTEDFFDHVPARLAPYLIVFECINDDLIVRLLGTQLVERWGADLTGRSWPSINPHLKAANLLANFQTLTRRPCGARALSSFVTNSGRSLNVETLSLPLIVKPGRPTRIISGSFSLEALGYDERSSGWQPPRLQEWLDVGFGLPQESPLPL